MGWHNVPGVAMLILNILIFIGGVAFFVMRMKMDYSWNTARILKLRKCHQIFGYVVFAISQVAIATGILQFKGLCSTGVFVGLYCANFGLIVIVLGVGEVVYRWKWFQQTPFVKFG